MLTCTKHCGGFCRISLSAPAIESLRLDSQAHRPIWLNEKAYGCRCVLLGLKWLPEAVRHRELGAAHEIPPVPRRFSEIFPTRGHCRSSHEPTEIPPLLWRR